MMPCPTMTDALASRIEQAELQDYLARLRAFQRQPGNPQGVQVKQFGQAMALMARKDSKNTVFNRVMLLSPAEIGLLDDIMAWYQGSGVRWHIDLVPNLCNQNLLIALARRGLYQCGFRHCLYGMPTIIQPPSGNDLKIEQIDPHQMTKWSEIFMKGFEIPEEAWAGCYDWLAIQYSDPQWRLYLASIDSQPAAVGAMHLADRVGSLSGATTLPAFRGRGCQTALLARRITDAAAAGCDLVVSQAGGSSQRNMERLGMRMAYTKVMWGALLVS